MHLVIVESPTKARKLKTYLGAGYQVEASVGHIRDLPESGLGVDLEHEFEPQYEVHSDKKKVLSTLETAAAKAEKVYLATDPDREGEAIAWHLRYLLENSKKTKLTDKDFLRATFHEITKSAVMDAISHPGEVRLQLVDAQQARRVVDRLVGYKISPVLWKKIRRGLSAGRVQSVALRLIVEREREIAAFVPEEYWEVDVALSVEQLSGGKVQPCFIDGKQVELLPDGMLVARVIEVNGKKIEPKTHQDVALLEQSLPEANYRVAKVDKTQRNRYSLPPFTTSTLQQKASTMLGMSSKQTMRLAQDLYEEGLITYHRTDSVTLSQAALEMARDYITKQYGSQYLPAKVRVFANSSKNAQEAHEAIRVTQLNIKGDAIRQESSRFTERHVALYNLIWRRFLASQMETAVYDQTTATIDFAHAAKSVVGVARVTGSVLKFDGWTKLFPNNEDVVLPELHEQQDLTYAQGNFAQKFTLPPARYNDASLVKTLEKMGIGRPSTYASIISVIIDRGYVERTDRKFFATSIGMTVTDFLLEHFTTIMDYEFTAEMEEDLDRIARGEKQWRKVVGAFYGPFEKKLASVEKTAERVAVPVEKTGEPCPDCGQTDGGEIVIRTGRFGKFKSCSRFPECKYTQNIVQTVPGVVCPLCHQGEVLVRSTRWGKSFFGCRRYPECDWASWSQPKPGDSVSPEEWKIQQEKRAARKTARAATMASKSAASKARAIKKAGGATTTRKASSKSGSKASQKATRSSSSTRRASKSTKPTAAKQTAAKRGASATS